MLIRFIIKNFMSFDEETEFNMFASEDTTAHPNHVTEINGMRLVHCAAIYGANGAGKSNFVKALQTLRNIIVENKLPYEDIYYKLNPARKDEPTIFKIEFIAENKKVYFYQITFFPSFIKSESLYEVDVLGDNEDLIFERNTKLDGKTTITTHPKYNTEEKDKILLGVYGQLVKPTKSIIYLLASEVQESFILEIKVTQYFLYRLGYANLNAMNTAAGSLCFFLIKYPNKKTSQLIKSLFLSLETGILGFNIESQDLRTYLGANENTHYQSIVKELVNREYVVINNELGVIAILENKIPTIKILQTVRKDSNGKEVYFSLNQESDGTRRLLAMTFMILSFFSYLNHILIFDEIEQHIHPALLKELLKHILTTEKIEGQLIFTTHESHLIDLSLFRTEEIFFMEKNKQGASSIYPLYDFKDLDKIKDLQKGYLQGRFGGIPYLGLLKHLKNKEEHGEIE